MNSSKADKNDICTEVFKSKAVLVGSPTVNYGFMYSIGGILEMMKGLKFKNKKAAAFGSYGWTGEAPKQIHEHLEAGGFRVIADDLKVMWVPDEESRKLCVQFGRDFVRALEQ